MSFVAEAVAVAHGRSAPGERAGRGVPMDVRRRVHTFRVPGGLVQQTSRLHNSCFWLVRKAQDE